MPLTGFELVTPVLSSAGGKRAESVAHERMRRAGYSHPALRSLQNAGVFAAMRVSGQRKTCETP
ncbi:MAG: hypothetical protein O7F12_10950, partial [Nitrospirae bacterium]|nr:hypothetical protein [Nitrospirota bacterium]